MGTRKKYVASNMGLNSDSPIAKLNRAKWGKLSDHPLAQVLFVQNMIEKHAETFKDSTQSERFRKAVPLEVNNVYEAKILKHVITAFREKDSKFFLEFAAILDLDKEKQVVDYTGFNLIATYVLCQEFKIPTTTKNLLDLIVVFFKRDLMDESTVRKICKSQGLPIVPDKGRKPKAHSETHPLIQALKKDLAP